MILPNFGTMNTMSTAWGVANSHIASQVQTLRQREQMSCYVTRSDVTLVAFRSVSRS